MYFFALGSTEGVVMTNATELLSRALDAIEYAYKGHRVAEQIRAFLAAETEAEPVAYINLDEKRLEWAVPFEFKSSCFVLGKLPLYLHPPKPAEPTARKPMNGDEILAGFQATGFTNTDYRLRCFIEGVRFAEQSNGISSSMPSLNDTISANSQDLGP
jgi:hypothetical protein